MKGVSGVAGTAAGTPEVNDNSKWMRRVRYFQDCCGCSHTDIGSLFGF